MKTKMQATSLISYYNIIDQLGNRQKQVLLALKHLKCANNMMISKYLNIPLQSVCGRMSELRKSGVVIFHHTSACPYTRETTRFFIIKKWITEVMI